jgi:hypothetical protein
MTIRLDLLYTVSALRVREISIEWEAGGSRSGRDEKSTLLQGEGTETAPAADIRYRGANHYRINGYVNTQLNGDRNMLSCGGEY